jgi:hypothetical protein
LGLESTNLNLVEIESLVLVVSVVVELDSVSEVCLLELGTLDLLVGLSLLDTGNVVGSVLDVDGSLGVDGSVEGLLVDNPSSSLGVGLNDVSPLDALVLSVDSLPLNALLTVSSDTVILVGINSIGLANWLLSTSDLGGGSSSGLSSSDLNSRTTSLDSGGGSSG